MPAARMRSWTSTLGTGDSPQPHIPLWDIQASGRCRNNGFCSATPQSDFLGMSGISLPLGFRETSNCSRARDTYKYPITSKEDQDTLPEMIRKDPDNLPHIDVCFASAAEIEAQSLVEVVEVLEAVEVVTAQPHTSVHRTKVLEQALKKISVPTMRQKNGPVNAKIALLSDFLLCSTEQVRIPHAWEAALPTTPKKERFHVKPKKPQTHSVTQASGRQNISGDVRNHPDLISTVKKNRHNTNRDGQPKIGPIKRK
ncbi:hypothetical protein BASA61_010555 [Batrachochytrium salamandrivorans]|nr:hypothetical protein BASA61_010555 [Batrachochytrium salamandrivorans]